MPVKGTDSSPLEVRKLTENQAVRIDWDDGHTSTYPWDYLRGWCPCAECQGHGGGSRFVPPGSVELAGIEAVGRYALGFSWADGHTAGIYTYSYLREICPCQDCRAGAQ